MDVIRTLGLKNKGRQFNPLYDDFVWVKKKVSKLVDDKMGITKNARKDLTLKQIQEFFDTRHLEEIKKECEAYFRGKLAEKEQK